MPDRTLTLARRCLTLSSRSVDAIITSITLPVMIMIMFVLLFGGALQDDGRYVDYVVPGVLVLCATLTAAGTAVTMTQDLAGGIVERWRALDVPGAAIVAGHVVASVARTAAAAVATLVTALLLGYRTSAGPARIGLVVALVLLHVVCVSALAAWVGMLLGSVDAANGISMMSMFLVYPTSAFVVVATMPSWLRGFATHQPFNQVIVAVRGLLTAGADVPDATWHALGQSVVWCGAGLLLAVLGSTWAFARRAE